MSTIFEADDDLISVLSYNDKENSPINDGVSNLSIGYADVARLNNDNVSIKIGSDCFNDRNCTISGDIDCDEISVISYNENVDEEVDIQHYMSDEEDFCCTYDESDSDYSDDIYDNDSDNCDR